MPSLSNVVWFVLIGAELGLLFRLLTSRASKLFPWLTVHTGLAASENILRLGLYGLVSAGYTTAIRYDGKLYALFEFLLAAALVAIIRELWLHIAHEHIALARLGSFVVIGAAVGVLSVSTVLALAGRNGFAEAAMRMLITVHSAADGAAALFLLVIWMFILVFPVVLMANVLAYFRSFLVYYLTEWIVIGIIASWPAQREVWNLVLVGAGIASRGYLLLTLCAPDRDESRVSGPADTERAQVLRRRLQYLDRTAQELLGPFGS